MNKVQHLMWFSHVSDLKFIAPQCLSLTCLYESFQTIIRVHINSHRSTEAEPAENN